MFGVPFPNGARVGLDLVVPLKGGKRLYTEAQIDADVAFVNRYFSRSGISFFKNTYTVSDSIPLEVDDSIAKNPIFRHGASLTVLYAEKVVSGGEVVGGVAWNDGSGVVVFSVSGPLNPILAHELGHSLGLRHTDLCGPDNDGVADTPFDPGPSNWNCQARQSEGTCQLSSSCAAPACASCGVTCDAPNAVAAPDGLNVMSHYLAPCQRFTPGQEELMRCTLRNERSRLLQEPPATGCVSAASFPGRNVSSSQCASVNGDAIELAPPAHCAPPHHAASAVVMLNPGRYRLSAHLDCRGPAQFLWSACAAAVTAQTDVGGGAWNHIGQSAPKLFAVGAVEVETEISVPSCKPYRLVVGRVVNQQSLRVIGVNSWSFARIGD